MISLPQTLAIALMILFGALGCLTLVKMRRDQKTNRKAQTKGQPKNEGTAEEGQGRETQGCRCTCRSIP